MKRLMLSLVAVSLCCSFSNGFSNTAEESYVDEVNPVFKEEEKKAPCQIDVDGPFADDRVLVTLKANVSNPEGLSEDRLEQIFEEIDCVSVEDISKVKLNPRLEAYYKDHPFHQIYCLNLETKSKQNVIDVCEILGKKEDVLSASPDFYCENASSDSGETNYYDQQWGLHGEYGINAPAAWNITRGNDRTVTVGIIDSGIHNHPDLNNNIVPGWDFWNENNVTNDGDDDHGTHVAGIVAACANGNGVFGVAPNVKVMPLQVESPFSNNGKHANFWSTQIKAVSHAARLWGTSSQVSVLNRSIGFSLFGIQSSTFDFLTSFTGAISNFPGLVVISAGNEETNIDEGSFIDTYSLPNLIVVGATDEYGQRASFSNYGDAVSIFAPGMNIVSTIKNGGRKTKNGTSMATPFVSGTAALIYSMNPGLEAARVKEAILEGSIDTTITGANGYRYNTKRLSAYGALNYAQTHFEQVKAPLRIGFVNKVNASTWNVKIQNPNNFTVYAGYNEKTCYESDAKNFRGVYHVKVVKISSNSSQTVQITNNGDANWYTVAYGYERGSKRYLKVSCTNDTGAAQPSPTPVTGPAIPVGDIGIQMSVYSNEYDYSARMVGIVGNGFTDSAFPTVTSAPTALSLKITATPGWFSTGSVTITNSWRNKVKIRYRKKLCFEEDAKNMIKSDTAFTYLNANDSMNKTYESNGWADYYATSVDYYYRGFFYSAVSYIKSDKNSQTKVNLMMWF